MPSPSAAVSLRILKLFLLLLSGNMLYQGGTNYWLRAQLARHGRLTQATVVGLTEAAGENESGVYLQLRFTTATGAVVQTSSQETHDALAYQVGQRVAQRYDPRAPQRCLTEQERGSR